MDKNSEDEIVITALLKRFTDHRLPKARDLEKKVLKGETLTDSDVLFLETVFNDAQYILRLSDKHPEFQALMSKAIQLYTDITQKALENEKTHQK
jgi:hypothetical protein